MDRLTIPDESIDGGMRRAVVDVRTVKEQAITLYWALKAYEDTGLTPGEITDGKMLTSWVPVEERLPEPLKKVLVYYDTGRMDIDCWYHDGDYLFHSFGNALAWMSLPEPFHPQI